MFWAVDKRVRSGPLENAKRDGRITVEIGIGRIVLRGKLDLCDVLHPHDGICRLLDDDVAEFFGTAQPAERLHRNLECARLVHWRLIEHAGGNLNVLPCKRGHHVICCQPERLQPVRVEPRTHCIVAAAEHND